VSKRKPHVCTCAGCTGEGDPHPRYGYDRNKVKTVRCLMCDELIGDEEYVENTSLARFGNMFFTHRRCSTARQGAIPNCFKGPEQFRKGGTTNE